VAAHLSVRISAEPRAVLDHAEVVDPLTLEPLDELLPGTTVRLIVAAKFGSTRLLDNLGVEVP
jgi:pantothenate synthetase